MTMSLTGRIRHLSASRTAAAPAVAAAASGVRDAVVRRVSGRRLFELELEAEVSAIRKRLEVGRLRSQRHDLVNAFTAVEGAATIMGRETLSPADRATLSEVLGSGLIRLRKLLIGEEGHRVAMADLLAPLARDPRWRDRLVLLIPADLVAACSPAETVEAIRLLITYACDRAQQSPAGSGGHQQSPAGSGGHQQSPLTLRGVDHGDRVELRVEDLGPALSAREQRVLLQPTFAAGAPRGAQVAIRMLRDGGGDVKIEGGQCFAISLPVNRA